MQENINTSENWDFASQGYGEKIAPFLMASFADAMVDRLDVNPELSAVEVAAGTGALTIRLAQRVKSLLATDFAPKMLAVARRNIDNAGLDNVSFAIMDGQALELEDDTFDRAACSFGLMLFPDRHQGFLELHRVVKPGGKAVVSGWASPDRFQGFDLFLEGIQTAFPDFPMPEQPPPVFSLADPQDFKAQMEAAGFSDVKVDYVAREQVISNFDEMWGRLTIGVPPIRKLFDQIGQDGIGHLHDALQSIVRKRFGDGPISVTNTATIGYGVV
jgi:SAM-dependent methyltransferase